MHDLNAIKLPRKLSGWRALRLPGLKGMVLLIASLTVGLSFLIAAGTLLWHALHERHAFVHQGLAASVSTIGRLDREVQALGNLLKGLSRSPYLHEGDLRKFYDQLRATPHPEGASFILWDLDRQLINTGRPYGASLPRIDDLPNVRQRVAVVRREGLSLSDQVDNPQVGTRTVSVSLRLDEPDGEMTRILSLVMPHGRFGEAVRDSDVAPGWRTIVLDRKLQDLPVAGKDAHPVIVPISADLRTHLSQPDRNGHFEVESGSGEILVAFQRSDISGYTSVAFAPAALIDAPLQKAIYQIVLAGGVLLLIGGASAMMLMRNVGPVDTLRLDAVATRAELAATNARLNAILESVSDCYFTLDRSYLITNVNTAAIRWWGLPRGTVVGRSYFEIVGHDPAFDTALAQAIEHRREFQGVLASIYRPGRYIDYRVYPSAEGASVFFDDVTERHATHLSTLEERELLQSSLDALSAHLAILDEHGTILSVNRAWHRFAQENDYRDPSHGIGANYLDASVREERIFRGLEAVISGEESRFRVVYRCDTPVRIRWFQLRASRFTVGSRVRIIVAHEDITDLMEAKGAVNEMAGKLLTLQEEERQRIAAELHDSTAQHLVAVGLSLMRMDPFVGPSAGRRILDEIDRSLEKALTELRVFTYLLHPRELEAEGLKGAICSFATGFSERTALRVNVRVAEEANTLSVDLQRSLLRIVQEALANVHRHARAETVSIDLRMVPDAVILCIGDDGHGMRRPVGSSPNPPTLGVGIPGMRIRLHQFGGSLKIRSSRRGTVVRASIPRDVIVSMGSNGRISEHG